LGTVEGLSELVEILGDGVVIEDNDDLLDEEARENFHEVADGGGISLGKCLLVSFQLGQVKGLAGVFERLRSGPHCADVQAPSVVGYAVLRAPRVRDAESYRGGTGFG
jgi:hypothetical protein